MFLREAYYLYKTSRQENYSLKKRKELQLFFLKNLVEHAYGHNRFYRRLYGRAGFHPRDLESLADLEKIPVVRKADILRGRELFYDARFQASSRVLYTSGSTGDPFRVYLDEEASDYTNCIFIRTLMAQGYEPLSPLGFYWYRKERNSAFTGLGLCRKVLFSPSSTPLNQLEAIRRHRLRYIYHFPFKLYEFANHFDEETIRNLGVKRIFCIGEMLTPSMKRFFEERFGCSVTDNYGLTEFNIAAYQKQHEEHYTINDDSVLFETSEIDDPQFPDNVKGTVLTSFYNYVTPFIRYETQDYVEMFKASGELKRILGQKEHFISVDKSYVYLGELVDLLVGFADSIFLFSFSVWKNRLTIHAVPKESYDKQVEGALVARVKEVMPKELQVNVTLRKQIQFSSRGKLRILRT